MAKKSVSKRKTKPLPKPKKKRVPRGLTYQVSTVNGRKLIKLLFPKGLLLRGFLIGGPLRVAHEINLYDDGPDRIPWTHRSKGDTVKWVNKSSQATIEVTFIDPWPFDYPEEPIIVKNTTKPYNVRGGATKMTYRYETDPELKPAPGSSGTGPTEPSVIVDD